MNLMKKKLNKKGFTLAELLIVVAIIAILAAIAIPVFSNQLDKSRKAVDDANARSITSMAVADAMLMGNGGTYYGKLVNDELQVEETNTAPTPGYNQFKLSESLTKGKAVYKVIVNEDFSIDTANSGWVSQGS